MVRVRRDDRAAADGIGYGRTTTMTRALGLLLASTLALACHRSSAVTDVRTTLPGGRVLVEIAGWHFDTTALEVLGGERRAAVDAYLETACKLLREAGVDGPARTRPLFRILNHGAYTRGRISARGDRGDREAAEAFRRERAADEGADASFWFPFAPPLLEPAGEEPVPLVLLPPPPLVRAELAARRSRSSPSASARMFEAHRVARRPEHFARVPMTVRGERRYDANPQLATRYIDAFEAGVVIVHPNDAAELDRDLARALEPSAVLRIDATAVAAGIWSATIVPGALPPRNEIGFPLLDANSAGRPWLDRVSRERGPWYANLVTSPDPLDRIDRHTEFVWPTPLSEPLSHADDVVVFESQHLCATEAWLRRGDPLMLVHATNGSRPLQPDFRITRDPLGALEPALLTAAVQIDVPPDRFVRLLAAMRGAKLTDDQVAALAAPLAAAHRDFTQSLRAPSAAATSR